MPAENQQAVPKLEFNTPDAGRSYIAKLFETSLRRHDYRQYINERLAADFACTLAQHFEEIKAREAALQLLMNERDEQNHSLEQRRQAEQQARMAAERRIEELTTFELQPPVAPWFYFVECDDPDYSGLFNHESEAQTQANDHGGVVVKLWNVPPTWRPVEQPAPAYKGQGEPVLQWSDDNGLTWMDGKENEMVSARCAGWKTRTLYRHPTEQPAPVAVCTWAQEDGAGIWNSSCGVCWSFHDDGPEENGMSFCHSCGKHLVVEVAEPEQDADWSMNPCKQGHRDVGAACGVAHCYTCDEKIEAVTTQEAFEHWNATHPAEQPAPVAVVMPQDEKLMEIVERYPNGDPLEYDAALRQIKQ
jgi:hypothetical protein